MTSAYLLHLRVWVVLAEYHVPEYMPTLFLLVVLYSHLWEKILLQWSCFNTPLVSYWNILHPANSYSSFRTVQNHCLCFWDTLGFALIPFLHSINSICSHLTSSRKRVIFLFYFVALASEKHSIYSINFCCIRQE